MAKNNQNESAAEKIARLQAELVAAQEMASKEEAARLEKLANQIREFPKMLGVANFADVINLIKQVDKGTLGKLDATARTYKRLSDAEKGEITAALKKGEQVSTLALKYGVSDGTVYSLKQDAGLTKKRDAAPAGDKAAATA